MTSFPSWPPGSPRGDVLAQPTRARLFARLAGLGRPAGTDELELHPSGVRVHLERLRRAGLVSRERAPQDRGRPRDTWQLAPDAVPGDEPPDAYRKLARWLARSIASRPARLREVERSGQELGRELLPDRSRSAPAEAMGRTVTALGFAPQRERTPAGRLVFRLGSRRYRETVRENQEVVCTLHRGLTRGLLDELAPSTRLTAFVPEGSERAGCRIEVDVLTASDE
jgi:predicted ArsR family transcriptional regulator